MSKNFCTECGKALSLKANFCSVCGKKTFTGEIYLSAESKNICNNCGISHSATAIFCKSCGLKINKQESLLSNQNVCSYCGMQQSPTAVFCIGCGKKIRRDEYNRVSDEVNIKTADKNIFINDIPLETNKSRILNGKEISPVTESTAMISEAESLNTNINNITNSTADILADPQPMTDIKHTRCFLKRPVIITLAILVVFLSTFTIYLNDWLKIPFNKPIPYDPETVVYAADMEDWQNSPDLKKEQDAIARRQNKLISDLKKGNIEKAVKYFYPDYQSDWQKKMEDDPEGTATLAAVLSTAEMTFLSKDNMSNDNMSKDNPRSRTATFLVKFEKNGFYITWIKSDGTWYLYDF